MSLQSSCRAVLRPTAILCRSHAVARTFPFKSVLPRCHPNTDVDQLCARSHLAEFKGSIRMFCDHSGVGNELSVVQNDISKAPAERTESLFLDLSKSSQSALTPSHDMENINRKVSVFVNRMKVEIKAVDLYGAIRSMPVDEVLSLVGSSCSQLDKTHLCLCLKRLHTLSLEYQLNNYPDHEDFVKGIHGDRRFMGLCLEVGVKLQFLEPSVAADMLTFMSHFGLDSTHTVMKGLLQLSTHFINDLALDQLVIMADTVAGMTDTMEAKTLLKAIKILSNTREHQIDVLTPSLNIRLLVLFGGEITYADQLVSKLLEEYDDLELYECIELLKVLSFLPLEYVELEDFCLESIEAELENVDGADAATIAESCQRLGICPGSLFQALGQIKMSREDEIRVWLSFVDLGWLHGQLTDRVVETLALSGNNLARTGLSISQISRTLNHLAAVDRISDIGEAARRWIDKNAEELEKSLKPAELLDFCLSTSVLNSQHNTSLMKSVFSLEFLQQCQEETFDAVNGISAAEKLILLNDNTNFLSPNDGLMNDIKNINKKSRPEPELSGAISRLWPSAQHGCYTTSGLHVDHIVDLGDKRRVAVIVWPESYFWANTDQMKMKQKLYAKRIQADGYDVVVINARKWQETVDRERFDFLKNQIENAEKNKDLIMW